MKIEKQDLLIHGIVDGLLDVSEPTDKIKNDINKFNIFNIQHLGYSKKEKLFTNKRIKKPPNSIYELGIILGYPPKCVELWTKYFYFLQQGYVHQIYNTTINYNSICFNAMDLVDYAIDWCESKYRKQILKVFDKSTLYVNSILY